MRVIDTQSNLYLWGQGGRLFDHGTGKRDGDRSRLEGKRRKPCRLPDARQRGTDAYARVTKNADPRFYQDYLFHISRALTLRDRDGIQAKLDGTDAALFQLENGKLTGAQGFDNEVLDYQPNVRGAKSSFCRRRPIRAIISFDRRRDRLRRRRARLPQN